MAWCICGASERSFRSRREHEQACRHPDAPKWSEVNPHKAVPSPVVTRPAAPAVTRAVVTSVVTQQASGVVTPGSSSTARGRRWLAANRAKRNAYMRDYRDRKRAEARPVRA